MPDEAPSARARHVGSGVAMDVCANGGRFGSVLPARFATWSVRELADQVAYSLGAVYEDALSAIVAAYDQVTDR